MRVAKTPFRFMLSLAASLVLALGAAYSAAAPAPTAPLKIAYSDWPGWVAWQVAIDKGWLKEAGVSATFEWFDYVPSMDAFSAGKVDAVTMTNGDALVTGAAGAKSVMILITDYSNGNDMIVARPQYKSLKDLKGQKIGIEVGFVEHLMLLDGLQKAGMTESDVELVNVKTNETPQVLASGQVAAIGAWQPNSGAAMKAVPGAKPIYTSAQAPGLIYDVVAVNPTSLASRRADWAKLVMVWDRVVKYINDPKTQDDAVMVVKSVDGGVNFSKVLRVSGVRPFDQGTTPTSFRTNGFQTMTVDGTGRGFNAQHLRAHGGDRTGDLIHSFPAHTQRHQKPAHL